MFLTNFFSLTKEIISWPCQLLKIQLTVVPFPGQWLFGTQIISEYPFTVVGAPLSPAFELAW